MATFVLFAGSFHGGWCWRDVRRALTAAGHDVLTPSLTGLGDRRHLVSRDVELSTHIDDVVAVAESEDLGDEAVIVAHSYAGMPVGSAAERLSGRGIRFVFFDAFVPEPDRSALDLMAAPLAQAFIDSQVASPDGLVPLSETALIRWGLEGVEREWVARNADPHPFATLAQRSPLTRPLGALGLELAYVHCTRKPTDDPFCDFSAATRDDPAWIHSSVDAIHDFMVADPALTAQVLVDLGRRWGVVS